MATNTLSLGGRLALLAPDTLDSDQKKLHEVINAKMVPWAEKSGFEANTLDGHLIGPFNPMLYSPLLSQAALKLVETEQEHTSLDKTVREVVILTVGAAWNSAYELYAHAAVAEKAGLDRAVIQGLAAGQTPEGLSDEQRVAHEFTRRLCTQHQIDEPLYRQAVDAFKEKGVVDLIFLAGNYMTIGGMLNAFAVPTPTPPAA